jgi:hypothetical protein
MLRMLKMPKDRDSEFRNRLIARVEALRAAALMTRGEFNAKVGPPIAKNWAKFVAANDTEAWSHLSVQTLERIAAAFEIGSQELLSFKS